MRYLFGAHYLFDVEIVIHPQSIIHSIETQDSSVLAQLGWPDMRLSILYTMSWPQKIYCSEITWPRLNLCNWHGSLTFKVPDNVKYPSMDLAHAAGRAGRTMTGVLSAADEKAFEAMLSSVSNSGFFDPRFKEAQEFLFLIIQCNHLVHFKCNVAKSKFK